MSKISCNDVLSELKKRKYNFGQSLRYIRQEQGLTIRKVANEVNKTSTYISDIERGNNKPPEKELMEMIMDVLNLQDMEIRCFLYDLAARERGGVSGDIVDYIMKNSNLRLAIRLAKHHNGGEEFWAECLSKMLMQ